MRFLKDTCKVLGFVYSEEEHLGHTEVCKKPLPAYHVSFWCSLAQDGVLMELQHWKVFKRLSWKGRTGWGWDLGFFRADSTLGHCARLVFWENFVCGPVVALFSNEFCLRNRHLSPHVSGADVQQGAHVVGWFHKGFRVPEIYCKLLPEKLLTKLDRMLVSTWCLRSSSLLSAGPCQACSYLKTLRFDTPFVP